MNLTWLFHNLLTNCTQKHSALIKYIRKPQLNNILKLFQIKIEILLVFNLKRFHIHLKLMHGIELMNHLMIGLLCEAQIHLIYLK